MSGDPGRALVRGIHVSATNIWRVYRHEWVTVYSLNAVLNRDDPLLDNLQQVLADGVSEYFNNHYAGRVRDEDVAFESETLGLTAHAELRLYLPNLKGEFKTEELARQYVQETPMTAESFLVQRDSDEDRELLSYGVTKLPG